MPEHLALNRLHVIKHALQTCITIFIIPLIEFTRLMQQRVALLYASQAVMTQDMRHFLEVAEVP